MRSGRVGSQLRSIGFKSPSFSMAEPEPARDANLRSLWEIIAAGSIRWPDHMCADVIEFHVFAQLWARRPPAAQTPTEEFVSLGQNCVIY